MSTEADIAFRNSDRWIEYSHRRYLALEDIRHRLNLRGSTWESTKSQFLQTRMSQAILLPLPSIEKTFWYFEADCIREKISKIEKLGTQVYDKIHSRQTFESELILNAGIEEAISSAIYEGANTTRRAAKEFLAQKRTPKDKAEQMLINNFNALQWTKRHLNEALTLDSILRLHEIVTQNTMAGPDVNYVGKFRDDTVSIGPHEGIDFTKVPIALMEAIQVSTQNKRFIHPLVRGILLHYFTGYIHPFFDGNGRTARSLFYFKCLKNDLRFVELLSISAYLKDRRQAYEGAFHNAVEHHGDVTFFVDFSLDSLLRALEIVDQKITFLQSIWTLQPKLDLKDGQIHLLQRLALNKFSHVTAEEYAHEIKRSREIGRQELKGLKNKELLKEEQRGKRLVYLVNSSKLKELTRQNIL